MQRRLEFDGTFYSYGGVKYGLIRGEGDVEFWEGIHSNKGNKVTKCY